MHKLTGPLLLMGSTPDASSIRHAIHFSGSEAMVYLQTPRRRYLVVPTMELCRARAETKKAVIFSPLDLALAPRDRRRLSGWVLGLLRKVGCRRVYVTPSFPLAIARRLERRGIRLRLLSSAALPQREIKTRAEIKKITIAQQAAVTAMQAVIRHLRQARISADGRLYFRGQPVTSESVRQLIGSELIRRECVPVNDTIVTCGPMAANPHARGSGPLRASQPIVVDIFPRHEATGYWGDLTRTLVKGRVPPVLRRMRRAVAEAQAAALRQLRAGVTVRRVHQAVEAVFQAHGFHTDMNPAQPSGFIHSTGHGVGLDLHEAPALAAGPGRLKSGHIVTVEPGLYYPDIGGVRLEDTVLVTRRGWRYLAPCRISGKV